MGSIWSRPSEHSPNAVTEIKPEVSAQQFNQLTPAKRPRTPSPPRRISSNAVSISDPQRLKVRCHSLFWSSKRDISRLLSGTDKLPTYTGLHKIPTWDYFFLNVSRDDVAAATAALSSLSHRGVSLSVEAANLHSAKRRRADAAVSKTGETSIVRGACPSAADVTAPWREVPYNIQLQRMRKKWRSALETVTSRMRSDAMVSRVTPWLRELKGAHAPVCSLVRVEGCSVGPDEDAVEIGRDYYRNKTEFTVGMSQEVCGIDGHVHTARPTVGYALGMISEGDFRVGEVCKECITTDREARRIAETVGEVVRRSGQPAYNRAMHTGYWRQVTVRTSKRTGQTLVAIMVSATKGLAATSRNDECTPWSDARCRQEIKKALEKIFEKCEKTFGLFWQATDDLHPVNAEITSEHVAGLSALEERLFELIFRVQLSAFFQVNTVMAERLYGVIRELAAPTAETFILDVCCGTGTIGLSLAGCAKGVVGIDSSEAAIEDAIHNAKRNGIGNAQFLAARAEKGIHDAIKLLPQNVECVAILDPPRAGLATNVIAAVRGAHAVKRVVYVSCEPNNLWKNVVALCRPTSNAFKGEPFRPMKAIGVDLFPHTPHGELVVQLER